MRRVPSFARPAGLAAILAIAACLPRARPAFAADAADPAAAVELPVPTTIREDCEGTCRAKLEVVWPTFVTNEGTCIIAGPVEEPRDGLYYRTTGGGEDCESMKVVSVATYVIGSRPVVITDSHKRRDDWSRI